MTVRAVDLVDVFVYLVVLGAFTQLFPEGTLSTLGGFFLVTALIIVLMLARGGVRRIFDSPIEVDDESHGL